MIKQLIKKLPKPIYKFFLCVYESFHARMLVSRNNLISANSNKRKLNERPKILFHHISGLSFGGTEKFLQILAKHINKSKFDVYYMYSNHSNDVKLNMNTNRQSYLGGDEINFIQYEHAGRSSKYPYEIYNMTPNILEVIKNNNIDLFVTAGSGYSEYPFNLVRNIPIILLNIFGSPTCQKNIARNVCISHAVANKIMGLTNSKHIEVMYIPSEGPVVTQPENLKNYRKQFGIGDSAVVFGRIGRADDAIFDSIGINAFEKVVKKYPNAHYMIMSPPPILVEIVRNENIPNVHFIEPTSSEDDVWAFHKSIDVLAHFRLDGESCGLNIIESMLVGNPIITHKSHIWNAHLEYLDESFSRVAEKDNINQYSSFMEEMIIAKQNGQLKVMGQRAIEKAEPLFLIKNKIAEFENWIKESLTAKT
jgi:glycosyltransferase involved in cell wall biosynthesis